MTPEELDLRSLQVGMPDLVVEGCSEDRSAPGAALAGLQSPLELTRHNLRHGVSIPQREGRFELSSVEMTASSTGWVT